MKEDAMLGAYAKTVSVLNTEALERNLLGCLLIEPELIEELDIDASHFVLKEHAQLFDIIQLLYRRSRSVDALVVVDELRRRGSSLGMAEVAGYITGVTSTAHAPAYVDRIREASIRRKLAMFGTTLVQRARTDDDLESLLSDVESAVREIASGKEPDTLRLAPDLAMDALEELQKKGPVPRVRTGFYDLDYTLGGGMEQEDLLLLVARPSMGKTTAAVQIAAHAAALGPVLLVSMEEKGTKVALKHLGRLAGLSYDEMSAANFNEAQLTRLSEGISKFAKLRLWIDDKPFHTPQSIRRVARQVLKREGSLTLVVIDYLQYMIQGGRSDDRRHRIGDAAKECKIMARELKIPVLLLAQLSRETERRYDKRPFLSDIKESGDVEQHADVIIGLYRDDYYDSNSPDKHITEAIVLKNRDGRVGTVPLAWRQQRFDNLDFGSKDQWQKRQQARRARQEGRG